MQEEVQTNLELVKIEKSVRHVVFTAGSWRLEYEMKQKLVQLLKEHKD